MRELHAFGEALEISCGVPERKQTHFESYWGSESIEFPKLPAEYQDDFEPTYVTPMGRNPHWNSLHQFRELQCLAMINRMGGAKLSAPTKFILAGYFRTHLYKIASVEQLKENPRLRVILPGDRKPLITSRNLHVTNGLSYDDLTEEEKAEAELQYSYEKEIIRQHIDCLLAAGDPISVIAGYSRRTPVENSMMNGKVPGITERREAIALLYSLDDLDESFLHYLSRKSRIHELERVREVIGREAAEELCENNYNTALQGSVICGHYYNYQEFKKIMPYQFAEICATSTDINDAINVIEQLTEEYNLLNRDCNSTREDFKLQKELYNPVLIQILYFERILLAFRVLKEEVESSAFDDISNSLLGIRGSQQEEEFVEGYLTSLHDALQSKSIHEVMTAGSSFLYK